jgi:hypothetical protein
LIRYAGKRKGSKDFSSLEPFYFRLELEQAEHFPGLEIQVYIIKDGTGGQAGHGAHRAKQRIEEPCANRSADVADGDAEAARRAFLISLIGER